MSGLEHPESKIEFEQQAEQLKQEAAELKADLDDSQAEALREIADGKEAYETITLGNLELDVKTWLPAAVENRLQRAFDESGDELADARVEDVQRALVDLTADEKYDQRFWKVYTEKYGKSGLVTAMNTILGPAMEEMKAEAQGGANAAMDGFRENV